jgi:hypothetical protein
MRTVWHTAILFTVILTAQAHADASSMGIGVTSCGQFAKAYTDTGGKVEVIYFAWAQGYMSGRNRTSLLEHGLSRDLQAKSTDSQEAFLRGYCDLHPLLRYWEAVETLFLELPSNKPFVAPDKSN